ncbi:TetR/AcrR family transcriptional regulator [Psychrobacillus sp. INOP01]|uniref:TetR/AcrR family transcriptional regulator n=1 Tax=Psychrobacillus sp. INOP01 TaxID=2829187 RepID=UPI001BA774FF|nr:TetR/AcrR family transcriptional regulator [Psychrobacillus sp. INOP01]QUG41634.1 TetR/AcrR family transcriptional regulator [Psychrobacillus sp. INOP01]
MSTKNNSKDVLIETASRLFRLRGYYGVGLKDIIEESGIPKGSLYHYFPKGKEQLAIAAINHTKDIVINEIQQLFDKIQDPIQAFQTHLEHLSEIIIKSDNIGFPIGTIAGETHSTSEPIRMACQLAFEEWQAIYRMKLLQSGYDKKQATDLGITVNLMIEGAILLSLTNKSIRPLEVAKMQITLLLRKEI